MKNSSRSHFPLCICAVESDLMRFPLTLIVLDRINGKGTKESHYKVSFASDFNATFLALLFLKIFSKKS